MSDYRVEIDAHGGPEVLELREFAPAEPAAGEIRVQNRAIGLNYSDIYLRTGQKGPHGDVTFPATPGGNAAGVVTRVGSAVSSFKPGDRVAYVSHGAYATETILAADRALPLPPFMSFDQAAASLLRGLTAEYLIHRLFRVGSDMTVLVHAAAGGMGQLLCPWLAAKGATVIGTVGTPDKARIAMERGCSLAINYRESDFVAETLAATNGEGVHIVYDAVGKDVFVPSLKCLQPMGTIASYGAASGPVPPFDIQQLHHNSLFVTRPRLRSYIATPEMLRNSARVFFEAVQRRDVSIEIDRTYPLQEVRQAHLDLESRRTSGCCILVP